MKHSIEALDIVTGIDPSHSLTSVQTDAEKSDEENLQEFEDKDVASPITISDDIGVKQRRKSSLAELSGVSKMYDVGNKGFLDEDERIIRNYDTNNDGSLSVNEIKKIAQDLSKEKAMTNLFKKIACFTSTAFILQLAAMFGLIWTALIVTRQTETQNGSLVDSSTGKIVGTQARGTTLMAKYNKEYGRRLLMLHGRRKLFNTEDFDFHGEMRRVQEDEPVARLPNITAANLEEIYNNFVAGVPTMVTVDVSGSNHNGQLGEIVYTPTPSANTTGSDRRELQDQEGAAAADPQEIEVNGTTYNVESSTSSQDCATLVGTEMGKSSPVYTVECCGTDECFVWVDANRPDASRRRRNRKLYGPSMANWINPPVWTDENGVMQHYCTAIIMRMNPYGSACEPGQDYVQCLPPPWTGGNYWEYTCPDGQECEWDEHPRTSHCIDVPSRAECTMESDCVGDSDCADISSPGFPNWVCKSCNEIWEVANGNNQYCDECFSPLSTIIEKSKGRMLLKNLQLGDSVLAANGKYQPYVFSIHSNPSKPTSFVQIHTDLSENDAPLEATHHHLVFVHGNDLPIQVGKVKVGDLLVGVDGPKTVTKVSTITREGLYSPLTGDATLFVDGVLASSASVYQDKERVSFGPFQVNIHTLSSWIGAPVMHAVCTKITPFFCETQVDDGSGGTLNVWMSIGRLIFALPRVLQAIIFPSIITMHVIGLMSYYVTLLGVTTLVVLGSIILTVKLKKKAKVD